MKKTSIKSLMQAEDKYKSIISVLSEGIVILTVDGIQESNASADRILGLDVHGQEGCVADDPNILLFNADGSSLALENHPCFVSLATGQEFKDVVIGFGREREELCWVSLNALPVWNTDSELPDTVVASIRIVTEEIRAKRILEAQREEAEARAAQLEIERHRLEEMLSELNKEREIREAFVSMLTHDLRTPLTGAMFGAQRLLRSDEDSVRRSAERILGNVNRLDRMIRDLLDANRLKAGHGLPVHISPCSLTKLLLESAESLSAIHGEKINLKIANELVADVCRDGLGRVLENLINNACKYGDKDGIVTVCLEKDDDAAIISVHNFGRPIEHLEALFQPFYRDIEANSFKKVGWGLGLVLVKGIIDAHKGAIEVESSLELGTLFKVKIPLHQDAL